MSFLNISLIAVSSTKPHLGLSVPFRLRGGGGMCSEFSVFVIFFNEYDLPSAVHLVDPAQNSGLGRRLPVCWTAVVPSAPTHRWDRYVVINP